MLVGHGGLVTLLVGRCAGWWMWVSPCGLIAVGWSLWVVVLLVGRCQLVGEEKKIRKCGSTTVDLGYNDNDRDP